MFATPVGDMNGQIALVIAMGADVVDISKTIESYPKMGESIGVAADIARGFCTDLPLQKT